MNMTEERAESYIDALLETVKSESVVDLQKAKTYVVKK